MQINLRPVVDVGKLLSVFPFHLKRFGAIRCDTSVDGIRVST
jgi:hypothetical protein